MSIINPKTYEDCQRLARTQDRSKSYIRADEIAQVHGIETPEMKSQIEFEEELDLAIENYYFYGLWELFFLVRDDSTKQNMLIEEVQLIMSPPIEMVTQLKFKKKLKCAFEDQNSRELWELFFLVQDNKPTQNRLVKKIKLMMYPLKGFSWPDPD